MFGYNFTVAGYTFWISFFLKISLHIYKKEYLECGGLIVGSIPFISIFRQFVFYNIPTALFLSIWVFYFLFDARNLRGIRYSSPLKYGFVLVAVYYVCSYVNTGSWIANIRIFEWLLSAGLVFVVSQNLGVFKESCMSFVISSIGIASGMLILMIRGESMRLGVVSPFYVSVPWEGGIGTNPVQFGLTLALCLALLNVDRGIWTNFFNYKVQRKLIYLVIPLLLLSTSRVGWLVGFFVVLFLVYKSGKNLRTVFFIIVLCVVSFLVFEQNTMRQSFNNAFESTVSDDITLGQRTSGRSDQWIMAWKFGQESVWNLFFGIGIGESEAYFPIVAKKYGFLSPASRLESHVWHALPLKLFIEGGLFLLSIYFIYMFKVLILIYRWTIRYRLYLPMVSFVGYLLLTLTITGFDMISGVYWGIALVATSLDKRFDEWKLKRSL